MEHLEFEYACSTEINTQTPYALVGVVTSNDLEVMVEHKPLAGKCSFAIDTSAKGFSHVWQAVTASFVEKHGASNLLFSINDNAASPAVVTLRLSQALDALRQG